MILFKRTILTLTFFISLIITFSSCKKQEITESTVSIGFPLANAKYDIGKTVVLKADITDPESILSVTWYLFGPDGDTVMSTPINEENYNLGTQYSIATTFRHGHNYYSTGIFTWRIYVANNYVTQITNRSFQIGEIDNTDRNFAFASVQSSSSPYRITLYDEQLNPFKSYQMNENPYYVGGFGKYMYAMGSSGLYQWDGFTGKEAKVLASVRSNQADFYYSENLLVSTYKTPPFISSYGKNGNELANIQNYFSESTSAIEVGESVYTIEYDRNDGRTKLVTYNAKTGAYLSNMILQQNFTVYGFFCFGNENRLYLVTSDPSNYYQAIFWYYNKSQNSIAQVPGSIMGRPVEQNPITIDNSKAWIFTTEGLYEFTSGDQIYTKNLNTTNNLEQVEYNRFIPSKNLLLYQIGNRCYVHNIQNDQQIGYLDSRYPVQILEQ